MWKQGSRWLAQKRVFLDVPFKEKDEAKLLGARFNVKVKKWHIAEHEIELFAKWEVIDPTNHEPVYLLVPFKEKDEAKQLGAKFDPEKRQWFAKRQDLHRFQKWPVAAEAKTFLVVPFGESEAVKALGAKYCRSERRWYVESQSLAGFEPWLPKPDSSKRLDNFGLEEICSFVFYC
ncbi:hypothetical protein BASA81_012345 [Batrachochytrium salamandrivorans]|nr:hypothetical protein BASA81_012345 [Batrachochytrium salamandrivorans]